MTRLLAVRLALLLALLPLTARAQEADPPTVPDGYAATLRVTYYTEAGVTYSGAWTRPGTAACSWEIPLGATITFRDGEQVVCLDRGRLTEPWVDLWRAPGLAARYGPYADVWVETPS